MKYYIPKFNLEKLIKLVNRLSKKTKVEFSYDEDDIVIEKYDEKGVEYKYATIGVELDINYKVGDYEVVAELEHYGKANVINQINLDYEVPTQYRTCKPYCEHCNKLRRRANTFLLVDKNHNYKQVGKSCLNDYTGIDTLSLIKQVSSIMKLLRKEGTIDDELRNWLLSDSAPKYEPVDYLVNRMYQLVLEKGYSKENQIPFADFDSYVYDEELSDKVNEILNVVNTDWYSDNEYCHNVKVIINAGYTTTKHWKLLLSYVSSALKYLQKQEQKRLRERERELKLQSESNKYLGSVGDKIEFEVASIVLLYEIPSQYYYTPDTNVYKIVTKTGQTIIWKTQQHIYEDGTDKDGNTLFGCMINGSDCYFTRIKGTIKELNEYKGEKQTVVTRCKIVDPIEWEEFRRMKREQHIQQNPEEFEVFKGKEYLKGSCDLAMAKFLDEVENN